MTGRPSRGPLCPLPVSSSRRGPRGVARHACCCAPCVWTWRGAPGRGVGCDLPLTGRAAPGAAAASLLRRGGHWRPERQSRRPCCGSSGRRRFRSDREVGGRLPGAWRQVALSPLGVQKALPPDALWPDVHPARSPAPGHGAAAPPPLGPVMARFPCGRRPRRPSGPVCGAPRASPAPTGPEVTPSSVLREVRELLFRQVGLPRWGLQVRPQGAGSSRAGGQSRPGEGGQAAACGAAVAVSTDLGCRLPQPASPSRASGGSAGGCFLAVTATSSEPGHRRAQSPRASGGVALAGPALQGTHTGASRGPSTPQTHRGVSYFFTFVCIGLFT